MHEFFKKKIIMTFFPLIEDVEFPIEDYRILRNRNTFFKQLNSLGYQFSNYVRVLRNNLNFSKTRLDGIVFKKTNSKSSKDVSA